jgi:hypothetical protein
MRAGPEIPVQVHAKPLPRWLLGVVILLLACALASCVQDPSASAAYGEDQGTVILNASSGGAMFWLFRNHDDGGNVCYGFASGATFPKGVIDSGGYCLDDTFGIMELDPITASSPQGIQMAVGGALSDKVARVEVIVSGVSYRAKIRHGFYLAAMPYGAFVVKAFDSHGKVLAEGHRPAPPTGPPPTPLLTPPAPPHS